MFIGLGRMSANKIASLVIARSFRGFLPKLRSNLPKIYWRSLLRRRKINYKWNFIWLLAM